MNARQECPPAGAGTIEESEFVFRREKEIGELRERFAARKSFVLHGSSGSGKTFLLQHVMPEFSNVLYCQEATSPQLVFQSLALALVASRDRFVRGWLRNPQAVKTKSAISLRGIVLNAVRRGNYFVVLDHLCGPAAALSSDTRDLMLYGGTPVVAVARSAHMEDLGFLTPFFAPRTERMRLPNFCLPEASQFAEEVARRINLRATNLRRIPGTRGGYGPRFARRNLENAANGAAYAVSPRRTHQDRAAVYRFSIGLARRKCILGRRKDGRWRRGRLGRETFLRISTGNPIPTCQMSSTLCFLVGVCRLLVGTSLLRTTTWRRHKPKCSITFVRNFECRRESEFSIRVAVQEETAQRANSPFPAGYQHVNAKFTLM